MAAPKKTIAKVKEVAEKVVLQEPKNIDKYLTDNGITTVYEGQKLHLTIDKIKELILNF